MRCAVKYGHLELADAIRARESDNCIEDDYESEAESSPEVVRISITTDSIVQRILESITVRWTSENGSPEAVKYVIAPREDLRLREDRADAWKRLQGDSEK